MNMNKCKQTVHCHSPASCKYPTFHLFPNQRTWWMSPLPAAVGPHTLIQTHSHTHTGSDRCSRLHILLFYFGCVDKRAGSCPKMVNGAVERSGTRTNQRCALDTRLPCDARTGFHWRKSRGSVRAKYKPTNDSGAHVGLLLDEKMLKIVTGWRYRRFLTGNTEGAVSGGIPGNTWRDPPYNRSFVFWFFYTEGWGNA